MTQWWVDYPIILGSRNPTTAQREKLYQRGFRTIKMDLSQTAAYCDPEEKNLRL